jgi:glycosyltransferase involved in cell wall biosynthesis
MPLTVLSIAYPLAPTSPHSVGGAEQVLAALDRALVQAGHTSLVVAAEGSEIAGRLWPVPASKHDVITDEDKRLARAQVQAAIDAALASWPAVDLIHMHGMDLAGYSLPGDVPVLMTLHLPISWYAKGVFDAAGANVHFCCVSQSQRAGAPQRLREAIVVENGVPLPPFSPDAPRENFALVMGRICPEKNQHAALEAGNRAGLPVYLGGQVFPYREHREYFDSCIQPLLGGSNPGHRFLGPLTAEHKQELLGRARCLLHPTLAPETSSLVAMEAMAAGSPVIAYGSGALPEIVEHGRTGFLVDSVQGMAAAIGDLDRISPRDCRAAAEQRFSRDRMVAGYFDLYHALAERARAYA